MSKSTVTTIIIATSLFLAGFVSISFMAYQINQKGQLLAAQVEAVDEANQQEDSYFKLNKLSYDTVEERALLSSYFLKNQGESVNFLNLIELIASETSVSLEISNLEVLSDKEDGQEWMGVSFTFSGSRERVLNFIKVLETLPYVLRVNSIEMRALSGTDWEAKISMKLQILNYDE